MSRFDDIKYLNRFVRGLWPQAADLLGAEITHMAMADFGDDLPAGVKMLRSKTRADLSSQPGFFPVDGDRVKLAVPASGAHVFKSLVRVFVPRPRARVEVDVALELTISADAEPKLDVFEVEVDSNRTGDFLDWVKDWQDDVHESIDGGEINEELGFFSAARYDGDAVPAIPHPERVYPDRELVEGGVNLVLVPDGFDSGDFERFDDIVEAVVDRLTAPDDDHVNEPFYSFKTALHVWTIKPEQTPDGDHVVGSYTRGEQHRAALGNLARLAAIGRAAERAGPGLTIVAFVANHEADRFGGDPPRAMALGNVILQPTRSNYADVLLHELGHTALGQLGDEYIEGDEDDEDSRHDVEYRGQPRAVANLTADSTLEKWQRWLDAPSELPSWDEYPIEGVEGGGYFGKGVWRPAADCVMEESPATAPFCAVCREALTNGFREALPEGEFLFDVGYPSGDTSYVEVGAEGHSDTLSEQVLVPPDEPVDLRIGLVAGTLPEPWQLSATLHGDGELRTRREHRTVPGGPSLPRETWAFSATAGDRLTMQIKSRCPFTPWDHLPAYTVELHCVPDPDEVKPPSTPSDLAAKQSSWGPPGTMQRARLSATAEDPNGQDLKLQFEVVRAGHDFRGRVNAESDWLPQPVKSPQVSGEVTHTALHGGYQFRARARNRSGRESSWSHPSNLTLRPQEPGNGGGGSGGGGGGGNDGGRPPVTP